MHIQNASRVPWVPIAVSAAFIAVAAFGLITFVNTQRIRRSEDLVAHSYAIREATHQLLSAMKDAETGERGYLLTGEAEYLEPFREGVRIANERFDELQRLVVPGSETELAMLRLRQAFEDQQAHFDKAITLRRQAPTERVSDEVLALIKSGRGKAAMHAARKAAGEIIAFHGDQLLENEAEAQFLANTSRATITTGNLLALALIAFTGFAAYRDRQKRDRAEAALIAQQAELASVIDSAFEGIITHGNDLVIRFMNPSAAEMLKVRRQDAVGCSLLDFVPSQRREEVSAFLSGIQDMELRGTTSVNRELIRANGQIFPTQGSISRSMTPTDQFFTFRFRDTSESAANLVRQQEFAAILEHVEEAVIVCDLDGAIRSCNAGAEKLLDIAKGAASGRRAQELLGGNETQWAQEQQRLFETGLSHSEVQWTSPRGKELIFEQRMSLIRSEEGKPIGELLLLADITERRREESRQRRSQRLESIGKLAGGVAHDLNNVLTPILMSAKLVKRGCNNPERLLDTIVMSAERGGKMIKKLLAFAGGDQSNLKPIDIREIVLEAQEILLHTLPKAIDIEISTPPSLPYVLADATELSQVLMNLAINARDAMPDGGRLEINLRAFQVDAVRAKNSDILRVGLHVLLVVSDNGVGIPDEIIDRVFDPFFTTKKQGKGTGLGLATTLGIVRSCGGDMNIYSEAGKGTSVSIYLPACSAAQHSLPAPNGREIAGGNGETVLIVDDELLIAEIARVALESHGYRVLSADGGAQAISIFQQSGSEIDLVLLDMMMPGMDGIETKVALQAMAPQVRILATSGLRRPRSEGDKLADVAGFLPKPYTEEELLLAVKNAIAAKAHTPL